MEPINFDNHLFRCSQLGKLMTEARSKTERLSETTKKYLYEIYIKRRFGREKEIRSKFLEKGLEVEELSMDTYSICTMEFVTKNETFFKNDFVCGTPDVITEDTIIDIKSSWDIHTFAAIKSEENKDYILQLQGYMWLTGKTKAKLAYVLTDTPEALIERELKQALYQSGLSADSEAFQDYAKEMQKQFRYEDLEYKDRIHIKEYEFDNSIIEPLCQRINDCREFLNKIIW